MISLRKTCALLGLVLACLFLATEIEARGGRRGGRGMGGGRPTFSRGGGAQMGSIGRRGPASRPGGFDRGGSMDRPSNRGGYERPRTDGYPARERPDRMERPNGYERPDRTERPNGYERPDRTGRPSRDDRTNRSERRDQVDSRAEAGRERRDDSDRPRETDDIDERRERREEARDRYQDEIDDRRDYWRNRDIYVGMVVYPATWSSYSCTKTTVVDSGVTYTQCGQYWYQRRYVGGSISYVVVDPPRGH